MLKLKNDALRDDVAAGRRQFCTSKQSISVGALLPPPPAWIMQPPRLAVPLNRIISPSEEKPDHYAKTTGRNPKYINEQCR